MIEFPLLIVFVESCCLLCNRCLLVRAMAVENVDFFELQRFVTLIDRLANLFFSEVSSAISSNEYLGINDERSSSLRFSKKLLG